MVVEELSPTSKAVLVSHEELVDRIGRSHSDGKMRISLTSIETILLEADDAQIEEVPELKRVQNRKGTGFITKKQVENVSAKVGFQGGVPDDHKAATKESMRINGRKGTGFVTKEKLLAKLDEIADGESDMAAASSDKKGARAGDRKGTGFITKDKLKKLVDTLGEEDDE